MILQKSQKINMAKIRSSKEFDDNVKELIIEYLKVESDYRYALRELSARLENLDDYCQANFDHNPIHHIESRIKSPESIIEKMTRRGHDFDMDRLKNYIYDIAGIRVICNYINDIYQIIWLLAKQKDLKILVQKDYIVRPKSSGYRSFHIVFLVETYINDECKTVPVEIQFRTLAMDMWASLEHELRYKSNNLLTDEQKLNLRKYADDLYNVDLNMQRLYIATTAYNNNEE
jgi:putative GTP pyrophosphokinase